MPENFRDRKGISLIPYFLITVCLLILDQITKYLAVARLNLGESVPLIKGVFHITPVLNRGIAFGLFRRNLFISEFVAFFAILAILVFFIRFSQSKKFLIKFSLALILAGCIGNLIDRLRLGAVIDFLDFRIWPVFNIADSAISIGACLLIFGLIGKR